MKRRRLILLGGGDFAREVLWFAGEVPLEQRDWEPFGLLDDDPDRASERLKGYGVNLPVLGTIADYQPKEGDCFVPAIGSPRGKLAMAEAIRQRGGQFINVVHPSASIAPNAELGSGIVVLPHVFISVNVRLGDFVTVLPFTMAGHDADVGDGSMVCTHCALNGHAKLGRGVFMGSHAVLLPHARVEDFGTVGAGSVVLRKARSGETVFGVPARPI